MYFSGLASRRCLQDNQWDDNIDVTLCSTMELMILSNEVDNLEDIIRNNNNTVDSDLLSDAQSIGEELTILTNTPDRPLVPNDLNTSNSILNGLVR